MSTTYHRTAIRRNGPSAPLRHVATYAPEALTGRVLDFGCGRGEDAALLGATPYDPHHPSARVRRLPRGPFDAVMAIYVLNVLPHRERVDALAHAASLVRRGGYLVLAVRPRSEVDPGNRNGQKGYTPASLRREWRAVLGPSFAETPLPALSGSVVQVLRRWR